MPSFCKLQKGYSFDAIHNLKSMNYKPKSSKKETISMAESLGISSLADFIHIDDFKEVDLSDDPHALDVQENYDEEDQTDNDNDSSIHEEESDVYYKTPECSSIKEETLNMDMKEWESFDLHPLLLKGLAEQSFKSPTKIQSAVLPVVLAGNRDVVGAAETVLPLPFIV